MFATATWHRPIEKIWVVWKKCRSVGFLNQRRIEMSHAQPLGVFDGGGMNPANLPSPATVLSGVHDVMYSR